MPKSILFMPTPLRVLRTTARRPLIRHLLRRLPRPSHHQGTLRSAMPRLTSTPSGLLASQTNSPAKWLFMVPMIDDCSSPSISAGTRPPCNGKNVRPTTSTLPYPESCEAWGGTQTMSRHLSYEFGFGRPSALDSFHYIPHFFCCVVNQLRGMGG